MAWHAKEDPHGRRPQPLTSDEVDELVEAFTTGTTINELALRLGVHRTTVMGHLRRRRVPRRGQWSDQAVRKAAARYEAGATLDQIARDLGVDPRTVGRQLRFAGVMLRPSGPRRLRTGDEEGPRVGAD